jgi:hypothetical protein
MADVLKKLESMMGMDDTVWARHASPWSVWTRIPILPLLALAIWSRVWLGWWCLAPIVGVVIWIYFNPRVFPAPAHLNAWASKGVLGERVFLARKAKPIPQHHVTWGVMLSVATGIGLIPLVYGLWALDFWLVVLGLVITVGGKLWFLDRMVWLLADMKAAEPADAAQ